MDINITVADVVYPAPGKKQGKLVDQTGKTWQVWGDKMGGYQVGGHYLVKKYKTSDFRGQTYYTIEEAIPVGAGPGTQQSAPAPRPTGQASGPAPTVTDAVRRMDIFVCGAFNNIMANPNTNPAMLQAQDMIEMIRRLKETWAKSFGRNEDMNDDIPF